MKKFFVILFLSLLYCNTILAESYYFKECKFGEKYSADYLIDFENNLVNVNFSELNGEFFQKRTYEIELVTKDQIITKKKQNMKYKDYYFQYFLNSNSKSIGSQKYKYENGYFRIDGAIKQNFCNNVKANWNKSKKKKEKKQNKLIESTLPRCQGNDYKKWTNCQGTFASSDGYKYVGEWKNGLLNGKGIEIWQDGKVYVGEFKNNKPDGRGTFTYPDGSKYVGKYKNGKRHGQGTHTFASGKIYSGKFENGVIIEGTASYPDGTKYVGKFKLGKPTKNADSTLDKSKKNISLDSKKWIKFDGDRSAVMKRLKNDFKKKAYELCLPAVDFKTLKQKIEIRKKEKNIIKESLSLKPKIKLGIDGLIECY